MTQRDQKVSTLSSYSREMCGQRDRDMKLFSITSEWSRASSDRLIIERRCFFLVSQIPRMCVLAWLLSGKGLILECIFQGIAWCGWCFKNLAWTLKIYTFKIHACYCICLPDIKELMREQGSNNVILTSTHREDLRLSSQDTIRKPSRVASVTAQLAACNNLYYMYSVNPRSNSSLNLCISEGWILAQSPES